MAEYIDREKLEADLNIRLSALREQNGYYDHYTDGFDECVDRVENFPAADVAPVKHGKWIEKPFLFGTSRFCSSCESNYGMPHEVFNYCPNCGAKMGLEDKI